MVKMYITMVFFTVAFRLLGAVDLPESQYLALYDLYNSTNGPSWEWLEPYVDHGIPWTFGPDANPCEDNWQGVICDEASYGYDITFIYHSDKNMDGTLPSSLSNLTSLYLLQLTTGNLRGHFPVALTTLRNLSFIDFSRNQLTGSLPASIGQLSELTVVNLSGNLLNGPIPDSLGELTKLVILVLSNNAFSGTIPSIFSKLGKLSTVTMDFNNLHGHIPENIGDLVELEILQIFQNHLSGPIPVSICNLTHLSDLHLQFNHLTSSIPACVSDMPSLFYFGVEVNYLTGTIPESIGTLTTLGSFQVNNNLLTGTIPQSIGALVNLVGFDLVHNYFVGTIPAAFWELPNLQNVYINVNHFTGRLPEFTATSSLLVHVNISTNHFHGTIPESLSFLSELVVLSMNQNLFTGSIPQSIGDIPLEVLQINNNAITGTIPSSMQQLTSLIVLSLKSNRLTGPLSEVFSAQQTNLITVQLDDNQFTGELPSVLFQLPSLISLSIVGSCLHGTLPTNICQATSLEALVLYGLTTGASCRATGVRALSVHRRAFGGAFPECVLSLPRLRTLLLASNGLTGHLAAANLSSKFVQLDLSHNLLTGSIPTAIQNHSWALLDLSHNRLDGSLSSEFFHDLNLTLHRNFLALHVPKMNISVSPGITVHSTLTLNTNRLSGVVPNNVKALRDVSMLAGNLFQCRYDKSDLPRHDSDISNYECASNSFDLSVYLWVGLVVAVSTVLAIVAWYYKLVWRSIQQRCEVSIPDSHVDGTSHLRRILLLFEKGNWVSVCCAAFCLCVLMPYYAVVSQFEGTHTHQYAYVLSAIYTSGALPFALEVVLLVALLLVFVVASGTKSETAIPAEESQHHPAPLVPRGKVFATFVAVNVTIVLGVNVAFVYTVLSQSSALQIFAQVVLSLFKLGWSSAVSPWMIRQLDNYFIPAASTSEGEKEVAAEPFFTLQLLVSLFNNIAIPCLVVMAVDPNCFNEILSPTETKSVQFLHPICVEDLRKGVVCQEIYYQPSWLTFTPPFTYSYQCSASFITSYAPTFVYMSIATVSIRKVVPIPKG